MHDLLQNPIIAVLLAIAVVVLIIYRQLRARRLSLRGLIIIPTVLLLLIVQSLPNFHPDQTKALEITLSAIVSTVLGLLACRQLRVYAGPNGKAMAKGSWTYFLWWLGALVIKSLLALVIGEVSAKNINQVEIFIPIFLLITTRNGYLYWKTTKLGLQLH